MIYRCRTQLPCRGRGLYQQGWFFGVSHAGHTFFGTGELKWRSEARLADWSGRPVHS